MSEISISLSSINLFILLPPILCYLFLLVIFFILAIVFFIAACLIFNSSISLFNVSCNLLLLPPVFFSPKILDYFYDHYSKVFSYRLLISTSLSCSSGLLSFSFISLIFLCRFLFCTALLCGFLFAGYRDVASLACGVCPFMGEVDTGVCVRLPDGRDWGLVPAHW